MCPSDYSVLRSTHNVPDFRQPSTQCLSLGAKWLGVAELSPPSAEVKNTCNCTAFPSCLHMVVLIKHRDKLLPFVFVYSSVVFYKEPFPICP